MIGEDAPTPAAQSGPTPRRSRRDLFVAAVGLATGGGVTLLASSARDARTKRPVARPSISTEAEADLAILNDLLSLERQSLAAYTIAFRRLAESEARRSAATFLSHERQHAVALERSIRDLGATPAKTPTSADFAADLSQLQSRREILELVLAVEHDAVAGYADALERVSIEDVRVTTAAVLATEAGHLAVALGQLGRPPITGPFVAPRRSFASA